MQMSFRWYGIGNDSISLDYIKQIPGMKEIVWALHKKNPGEVWTEDEISREIKILQDKGFRGSVVESVNIHDDIKLGLPTRDEYIDNYKETLINLAKHGVKVVCYNFMPIFDWTRSDLFHPLEDGSTALYFEKDKIMSFEPTELLSIFNNNTTNFTLPGWEPERMNRIKELFEAYENITEDKLRENFKYFIDAIVPVCEKWDIKMAIHPDDPPFSIFGLPRLVNNCENIEKLLSVNNSKYNCLTFCTGSLGSDNNNDLVEMLYKFQDRIPFMHIRNVRVDSSGNFSEVSHLNSDGTVNIIGIMKVLSEINYDGFVRPDHGRHIFGENATNVRPGYGLYDRAMGAMYLRGCWDMAKL
ncbi:mannonate dehydratase [Aerococcaceae bacterium zg-BR22]|uniref:mannonate dehydratase n=1 Tax=Aerococcaceae bacterium zg-1292 TaxID=2774330 RepID=UPI004064BA10|nr:mannonate dehydratase [Aerococcaceae bacterium zg-BR22]